MLTGTLRCLEDAGATNAQTAGWCVFATLTTASPGSYIYNVSLADASVAWKVHVKGMVAPVLEIDPDSGAVYTVTAYSDSVLLQMVDVSGSGAPTLKTVLDLSSDIDGVVQNGGSWFCESTNTLYILSGTVNGMNDIVVIVDLSTKKVVNTIPLCGDGSMPAAIMLTCGTAAQSTNDVSLEEAASAAATNATLYSVGVVQNSDNFAATVFVYDYTGASSTVLSAVIPGSNGGGGPGYGWAADSLVGYDYDPATGSQRLLASILDLQTQNATFWAVDLVANTSSFSKLLPYYPAAVTGPRA